MGAVRGPISFLLLFFTASACASGGRLVLPGSQLSASKPVAAAPATLVEHSNNRPLIGILAQACHNCPGRSYVAAAYVKWVEMAGARAVPIRFYVSDNELRRLFDSVNGVILPGEHTGLWLDDLCTVAAGKPSQVPIFNGGLTDLWLDDPYVVAASKLVKWAEAANAAGDVFPVWGTCLGHQLLQILATNASFEELLVETDAVSHPSTLQFTPAAKSSKVFGTMFSKRSDLVEMAEDSKENIIMENHEFGMPPAHYADWPVLNDTFTILSTTRDRKGVEYVSTIEHQWMPFFGTQWHPEKPPFEFSDDTIPHSHEAIAVSQHLSGVFMDYARRSSHGPVSVEEELAMLIYNYHAVFTARDIVMEPSYDGPDITYFLDLVATENSGLMSGLSKFN